MPRRPLHHHAKWRRFTDADLVGRPGWYVARPGFALGGAGVAAVWWGGAAGVLDRVLDHLRPVPDAHQLAHVGELHAALAASDALLAQTAAMVDDEVKKFVAVAHQEAFDILEENRDVLDALVLALLDKETLDKEEVAEVFEPLRRRLALGPEQRDFPAVKAMAASQDYIEGPKAFSEKRPPKWLGK